MILILCRAEITICWSIRVCLLPGFVWGGGGEVLWLLVVSEGVEDCILKCGLGVV